MDGKVSANHAIISTNSFKTTGGFCRGAIKTVSQLMKTTLGEKENERAKEHA